MPKRTSEGQMREMERIHAEALRLVKTFATTPPGTSRYARASRAAQKLLATLAEREREDRCYYCFATKKELGIESATGLTQCIDCAGDAYTKTHPRRSGHGVG